MQLPFDMFKNWAEQRSRESERFFSAEENVFLGCVSCYNVYKKAIYNGVNEKLT